MANSAFQFRRVDTFNRDMNRKDCFDILDMNGTDNNFKIILASECAANINDCLDEDGTLMEWDSVTRKGVQILYTLGESDGLVPLLYTQGINGEGTISVVPSSVSYDLTDDVDYVKAAFLVSYANGSGYVLAYSINNAPVEVYQNSLTFMVSGLIWAVTAKGGN